MSELRRLIVDTDTGSDDCWAIIEALRATDVVRVEAVTVVCGNFPLDLCVKNAMLAIEAAGTYLPPVYRGMERPLLSAKIFQADYVHGADGLGEMNLPASRRPVETAFAPDAIIDLVMAHPGPPSMRSRSWGLMEPSISSSPAETVSPSCTFSLEP